MIHIHPFPARMAPDIALERLERLPDNAVVLDPMCGSGMVLAQAARAGYKSIGSDLDPLARLISKVASTRIKEQAVWSYLAELREYCRKNDKKSVCLDWIDNHEETTRFLEYWFAPKQMRQMRMLANFFKETNPRFNSNYKNVVAVAVSRLIITKEPKASMARDTAHSRPHKTLDENDFDILENIDKSVEHVLKALRPEKIRVNSKTYLDDARTLKNVANNSVDAIITSPPYLNAIDYMRGHKFSLVWFGYNVDQLRKIRSSATGAEIALLSDRLDEFDSIIRELALTGLEKRAAGMLRRYYFDLKKLSYQTQRVLKRGGVAYFVVGNSTLKGIFVKNSELFKYAAQSVGLNFVGETVRDIPDNRRYLPISVKKGNSLSRRMRTEHVVELKR